MYGRLRAPFVCGTPAEFKMDSYVCTKCIKIPNCTSRRESGPSGSSTRHITCLPRVGDGGGVEAKELNRSELNDKEKNKII